MSDGAFGLIDCPAFDGHDDVAFCLAAYPDDLRPINHTITTGAANRCAGHFAAFRGRLLYRNVFGVQMNEAANDFSQPFVRVVPTKITVAGVEINADSGTFHEFVNPVQPG